MGHAGSHFVRYPLRGKLAIAAVSLFFLVELAALALWMMPLVPLVPVFVAIMIGNGLVVADVVRWAASLGRSEPVRLPRADRASAEKATEVERSGSAQAASAT